MPLEEWRSRLETIKAVFCFDENLTAPIHVAVASLLDSSVTDSVCFEIHCVCTQAAAWVEESLRRVVKERDEKSELLMHCIENPYADSYEVRGISAGAYLRLALHQILPGEDKILYLDVDILVRESLLPLWRTDLGEHILAAVKGPVGLSDKWAWNSDRPYWNLLSGMQGRYINSGVLLMNLAQIRRRRLDEQWEELGRRKLYYQDQDILNITCKDAMIYLPLACNRLAYMQEGDYYRFVEEGLSTKEEYELAMERPVIIHYAGEKPWNRYDTNLGNIWWAYVNSKPDLKFLFDEAKARRNHGPTLTDRVVRKIKQIFSREKL